MAAELGPTKLNAESHLILVHDSFSKDEEYMKGDPANWSF